MGFFALYQYSKTVAGKAMLGEIATKLPLFKDLILKAGLMRFCRTFASLLGSGVEFIKALDISADVCSHAQIEKSLHKSKYLILKGKSFGYALKRSKVFPPLVFNMVLIGEETGTIDSILLKVSEFYEQEVDVTVKGLIKLIEPFLIVGLGGAIAVIVLALYLPIFKIAGAATG